MIRSTLTRNALKGFSAVALLGISHLSFGQIMFNNGAQVTITPGAVVQVNGGLQNDGAAGIIDNNGWMEVASNPVASPGTFTLSNGSNTQGNGIYRVEQDWVNNATFTANNSNVELFGNTQQFVTGTVSTTFDTLILTGSGAGNNRKKTLQGVDATVDATGALFLNDRELETLTNSMFVLNTNPTAVTNITVPPGNEGFVSSDAPGVLSWNTASTSAYTFPVGSSVVATRYRPVDVTPNAATAATYTVRFINHNSDNDTYLRSINDGLLCTAIDTFYHAINRTNGAVAADITLYYIPSSDGSWNGMSQWRTTNNMWNDMATVTPGSAGVFTTLKRPNWLFANPGDPYILTELKPAAPSIVCPGTICANTTGVVFTVTGVATSYTWSAPGGTIVSGQGTDTLTVDWGSASGTVSVVATSASGTCSSLPDSCTLTVAPSPIAAFDTLSNGPFHNGYAFVDISTGGSTWYWDFGDGSTSTAQNPSHNYNGSGTYTVQQVVTNASGCIDTIQGVIVVNEGIIIPNVFSPDGDGVNDQFYIANSGMKEFSIEIFNRWGIKVFETTADEIRWDGTSTSGIRMSDGTYYYILKAISTAGKDYSTTGFLTLLNKK